MAKVRLMIVVSFGPIDSGQNGYFVRMRNLLEVFNSIVDKMIVLEYNEKYEEGKDARFMKMCSDYGVACLVLRGNERRNLPRLFKYLRLTFYQLFYIIRYRRILKRADVILTTGLMFIVTHMFVRAMNTKALLLAEPHMFFAERLERKGNRVLAVLMKALERFYLSMSDAVVAISPEASQKIRNYYGATRPRILLIPFFLSRDLREKKPQCSGVPRTERFTIFFIGDLSAPQNQEAVIFLIKALAILKKLANCNPRLLVIGRVSPSVKHAIMDEAKRLRLQNEVKLLGYVDDPDPYACMSSVLVAPMFTMSGVSTKMLYYLRFREKPVIASREAAEGLWKLVRLHGNVDVVETPLEFVKKLEGVCKEWKNSIVESTAIRA